MSHYIGDLTLGLSGQALAVLAMLSKLECDGLSEYDEKLHEYKIEIKSSAWYNGREHGVCLEVRPDIASSRCLLVTFGEHRNSDNIFVDAWEHEGRFLNPPTVADFTDEAYETRTMVDYGNIARAVEVIREKISDFIERSRTPTVTHRIHGNEVSLPVRVLPDLGEGGDAPAPARAPYRLAAKGVHGGGTSLQAEVTASFKAVCEILGKPQYCATKRDPDSDGKVSTQWIVTNDAGEVFTIYDFKETSLYDRSNPSPTAFRNQPSIDWHIGGKERTSAGRFAAWLREQLAERA